MRTRRGAETLQLTAQLGTDRASRTGDEDAFAGHVAGDLVDVGSDLVATEEVTFADGPDVGYADRAADQALHAG